MKSWNSKESYDVKIYSTPDCTYCTMAKGLAEDKGCKVEYLVFGKDFDRKEMMKEFPFARSFPQIIFNGEKIGGFAALVDILTNEI